MFWLICVSKELEKKEATCRRSVSTSWCIQCPCGWITCTWCVRVLYTTLCHSCVSDLNSSHITRLKFMYFGGQLLSVWGYLHHFSPRGWKYNRIFLMSMQCQGLPAPWTVTHVSPLWWHWCSAELSHCNLGYIKLSYSWDVTFFLSVERENPRELFFLQPRRCS